MCSKRYLLAALILAGSTALAVEQRVVNNGNLVMEDIPAIPERIVDDLNRYQNVRSAGFLDWSEDGKSIYISTRFGDVNQIHRVDRPDGTRRQLTFFDEPVGSVTRQPGSSALTFTRDAGGSEFSQVFTLDPANGTATMLTDGESRNGAVVWDRPGTRFAYQSTRRNGASNDIWQMQANDPDSAELVLESPDGSWWGPAEFSASGGKLLVTNYVSIADSRVHLLDLDTGNLEPVAGGGTEPSSNFALGFAGDEDGAWLITNRGGEFNQLAWQSFADADDVEIVTAKIPWDVNGGVISHDRRRIAFTVNENGRTALYLLDTKTRQYRRVDSLPTGVAGGLAFSPDDRYLGLTINTAQSPSDSYVLELGRAPLAFGGLTRWTYSEVGGLVTSAFRMPELVEYPTFDEVDGEKRQIPAWLYKPAGDGPFPVVVSIHGGPEGQSRPTFSSTYQMWLAKLGVAVVVPNVRGSAGYGKSYLELDNGFLREDSVRDIGALLDWIDTQPDLDAGRVAVFGGSYGGYMVLASAAHYSDRLRAAVDIVGISNFVTFLENTQDYRRDLRRVEYGDERDPDMRAHLQEISPLNNVADMDVPMLIVQGENDPRVPVTESAQMVEALREQGSPVWYMNALNEGHGYRKKENRDIYQQAVVLFLEQYLLGSD
ncbi:MAG: alpha/beta fold hydrolase [Woeseiaceae bacterium]|nr:alpha/beta fold hydrolase [Woeseiaceae bacterium]